MKLHVKLLFLEYQSIYLKKVSKKARISVNSSVIEQEVLYVIFVDPDTFKPTIKFFEVVAPADSQDAPGLQDAIKETFKSIHLNLCLRR